MFIKLKLNQKGQGLLEMLVAIFILVVALTATIVLIITSIKAGRESINKLIATSLAREGIEVVRNIRDSNWIDPSGPDWDSGLFGVDDNTAIPIIDGSYDITLDFDADVFTDTDARLKMNSNQYLQGLSLDEPDTQFYRLLYINPICQDDNDPAGERVVNKNDDFTCGQGGTYVFTYPNKVGLRVISEVHWLAPSGREVIIEDRLYNWQVL